MQEMNVKDLTPHPQNDYFFDDMEGEKWKEFLESVKTSGIIEPIVITQDRVIVSGHQRIRACKELGIEKVMTNMKYYKDEDSIIKDLLETNIRQRGNVGGSTVKLGRRIKELERIYGIKHGGDKSKSSNGTFGKTLTQEDLATKLGIDMNTLKRAKSLTFLPQEIQDLVEQGNITPSTASRVISKLSSDEQEDLLKALPATKKFTQKEIESYISQLKEKDNQIAGYEMKLKKIHILEDEIKTLNTKLQDRPVVEKEIIPSDYEDIKKENKGYQTDYKNLMKQYEAKVSEVTELKNQISSIMNISEEEKYQKKLKDNTIFFCARVNEFIEKVGGFVWLSEHISELPDYEKKSYMKAVQIVKNWAFAVEENINNNLD